MGGEEKAALIKAAAIIGGGLLVAWYVRRQANSAAQAVGDALSQAWDYVSSIPGEVVGAVWSADNMVPAGAGSATVPNWSGNRNTWPLIEYFQANGNSAGTRAAAAKAGWTASEISAAVAAMGSINGYY